MPLLERDSQLAALREYAEDAARGLGRLVLVEGEAGTGKSTLIEQLERSLPEACWLWGVCEALSTPRPLAPVRDMADQWDGELEALCAAGAGGGRVFETLVARLRDEQRLCVLVFEDVHWADDDTLDVVRRLASHLGRLAALALVSFRDDHHSPGLRVALAELVRQRTVRRVTLPALSAEAVGELVAGHDLDPAEVLRLTDGNPFFVAELLASGRDGLARTARDEALARVAELPDGARAAIETAALLGDRVDPGLVVRVARVAPTALDELVAAGLLLVSDGSLRFRHEITRLAVAQVVPPLRAERVHADALAARVERGGAGTSELVLHPEGAGDAAAELHLRALDWRTVGGGSLRPGLATERDHPDRWKEAEAWWREAVQVIPPDQPHALGGAIRMHARALQQLCRGPEALAAARSAVSILEPWGPSAELARARGEVAAHEVAHGDAIAGEASASAALALAEQLDLPDVAADALNVLGCLRVDDGGEWEAPLRRALAISYRVGALAQAARSYVSLYSSHVDLDEVPDGEEVFAAGLAYVEQHELPVHGSCLLATRVEALELTGRWDDSLALAAEVRDTAVSPATRLQLDLGPARVEVRRGTPAADAAVRRLLAAAEDTREPRWIASARMLRAEWHWLAGRHDEARSDLLVAGEAAAGGRFAGRVSLWLQRLGLPSVDPAPSRGPFTTQLGGDFVAAAAAWDELQRPYQAALARFDSAEPEALREALEIFRRLRAEPLAGLTRARLRERGVNAHGSRRSTVEHPAGLTRREQEVLELLCAGCSNAEIAARLVISVKTAGHHVSAVLTKLGVGNRRGAVEVARGRGLVPSNGEAASRT